ncbi:endonuclease/exonuclease/phosphatase family protein [Streptomyces sp. NPDC004976]
MSALARTYRERSGNGKSYAVAAAVVAALLTSTACGAGTADRPDAARPSDRPNTATPAEPGSAAPAEAAPDDEPTAKAAAAAVFTNRVATFNVCNPCRSPLKPWTLGRHIKRITNEIALYRPQVIALQEICVRETKAVVERLKAKGYKYHVAHGSVHTSSLRCHGSGNAYGNAILSAAPLTGKVNKRYTDGGSENRGYVSARTTIAGKKVRVFATHLAEKDQGAKRREQVKELVIAVDRYPNAIVLGDFNAAPTYSQLDPMWARFRDADPNCTDLRSGNPCKATMGKDSSKERKKFDYIFLRVDGRYSASGVGVHPNFSDHDLVHADLQVR